MRIGVVSDRTKPVRERGIFFNAVRKNRELLLVPLIRYIAILGNGGKPLDEEAEGAVAQNGDAESDLGNA